MIFIMTFPEQILFQSENSAGRKPVRLRKGHRKTNTKNYGEGKYSHGTGKKRRFKSQKDEEGHP